MISPLDSTQAATTFASIQQNAVAQSILHNKNA